MSDIDVRALTAIEARRLTDRIKSRVSELLPMIVEAFERRAWLALGHDSWDDYCDAELKGLRLPVGDRVDASTELYAAGMSQRSIGAALGVDHKTVGADLRRGEFSPRPAVIDTLGRQQPATKPTPAAATDSPVRGVEDGEPEPGTAGSPSTPTTGQPDLVPPAEGGDPVPATAGGAGSQPAPSAPSPLEKYLAGDQKLPRTGWQKQFMAAIGRSFTVAQFTPDQVAEYADRELVEELRQLVTDLDDYATRAEKAWAERNGLRVLKGGAA